MNIKIYYINLDKRKDRKKHMEEQFKKAGIKNYQRISAVDGSKLRNPPSYIVSSYGRKSLQKKKKDRGLDLTSGSVALALTYYKLFNRISKSKDDYCLIFEDDVILGDNFMNNLLKSIKELPPSWELFFLGAKSNGISLDTTNKELYKEKYSNTLWKPKFTHGTHSFMVNPNSCGKIISIIFPLTYQIDTDLSLNYDKINTFIRYPQITFATDEVLINNNINLGSDIQVIEHFCKKKDGFLIYQILIILLCIYFIYKHC